MSHLVEELRDCAEEISPRVQLLLMGMLQELDRMDDELRALADVVVGDRTYSITGGLTDDNQHDGSPGSDGALPGSTRPPTFTHHYARL